MMLLWLNMADAIGITSHLIACLCAAYLTYWCFWSWRATGLKIAAGAGWLMSVLSLMSLYRLSDFIVPNGSRADGLVVCFGSVTRIGLAATLAYVAIQVWKVGRRRE